MKLITRDTDYAIMALCFIARSKKKTVPVTELVATLKIPRPFLRKILQTLNKKGVLKSHKGKGGGFELMVSPKRIFLLDLINILQGPLKLNECIFKKAPCPDVQACKLKKGIDNIERYMLAQLNKVSIAYLLEKGV